MYRNSIYCIFRPFLHCNRRKKHTNSNLDFLHISKTLYIRLHKYFPGLVFNMSDRYDMDVDISNFKFSPFVLVDDHSFRHFAVDDRSSTRFLLLRSLWAFVSFFRVSHQHSIICLLYIAKLTTTNKCWYGLSWDPRDQLCRRSGETTHALYIFV